MSVTKGVGGKGWRCSAILNVNNLCQFLLIFCCLQEIHVRCWVMFWADLSLPGQVQQTRHLHNQRTCHQPTTSTGTLDKDRHGRDELNLITECFVTRTLELKTKVWSKKMIQTMMERNREFFLSHKWRINN